jgi:hypothetical protein
MTDLFKRIDSIGRAGDEFLFGWNAVLPAQFYEARPEAAAGEPLRRLMVAVLVDAVRCFQTKSEACSRAGLREFAEARSWIFSNDETGVFAFKSICDLLKIDPGTVRKWLLRWQDETAFGKKPRMIRRAPAACRRGDATVIAHETRECSGITGRP